MYVFPSVYSESPRKLARLTSQRFFLVTLLVLLVIYTVAEWVSTRHILRECSAAPQISQIMPQVQLAESDILEQKMITPAAKIAKVSMLYGDRMDELYERVLEGHEHHAELQGHQILVLRQRLMHGLWSKLAYVLSIVLRELEKPEAERLEWLLWFDMDMIVMNPLISLETFLPPDAPEFADVYLLATNDHNGLNSGSFFLRVNEWAAEYLIEIIALTTYNPNIKLKYTDQSAMEITTKKANNLKNTVFIPQRWINAYRGPRNQFEELKPGVKVPPNTITPGDLHLHFAGKKGVKQYLEPWLEIAANSTDIWRVPLEETGLVAEVAAFWDKQRNRHSSL